MASKWRIRHKLMLGLGLVVMTIALLLGGTLRALWANFLTINSIRDGMDELKAAVEFKDAVKEMDSQLTPSAPDKDEQKAGPVDVPSFLSSVTVCRQKLDEYEKQLNKYGDPGAESNHVEHHKGLVKKLNGYFSSLLGETGTLNEPITRPNTPVQRVWDERIGILRPWLKQIDLTASDIVRDTYKHIDATAQSRPTYQGAFKIIIPASIVGFLSMAGLLRAFYGWVFTPIRDLEAGVKRAAAGDFDHRIELHSGDEMEDLAAAFNNMMARLQDLYGDLARQVNERSRQLVRSERLASVGFLAAGVAHEINNPLASIAFCSEALEARLADLIRSGRSGRRTDDEEVFARYLKMIQDEAFRCKKITEKLLEFSRSGERRRETTDLATLIQSVMDITQHLQSCRGKAIAFDPPPDGTPAAHIAVPVNAEEIKSVVLNLVVNALDSMEEGGKLTIRLGLRDGMAEMRFSDTGCGMTQEVLENIFEPFFTRSRTGKGTGLGLTISHRIVNQHGGEIEAMSDGVNRGSTFVVRLPLIESEPRLAQTSPLGERTRRAA